MRILNREIAVGKGFCRKSSGETANLETGGKKKPRPPTPAATPTGQPGCLFTIHKAYVSPAPTKNNNTPLDNYTYTC